MIGVVVGVAARRGLDGVRAGATATQAYSPAHGAAGTSTTANCFSSRCASSQSASRGCAAAPCRPLRGACAGARGASPAKAALSPPAGLLPPLAPSSSLRALVPAGCSTSRLVHVLLLVLCLVSRVRASTLKSAFSSCSLWSSFQLTKRDTQRALLSHTHTGRYVHAAFVSLCSRRWKRART